jgi:predicted  nucleic acid-binding Zn-ribbon protein
MSEITNSLEWAGVQIKLEHSAKQMKRYSNEMLRMSSNIGTMVKALSEEEINCRRQAKQTQKHRELLAKINEEIANYERYITFGVLLSG